MASKVQALRAEALVLASRLWRRLHHWHQYVTFKSRSDGTSHFDYEFCSMFLPRDACIKRGLSRHAVSVCLSVTFVVSVKTNKHILKMFSPSGSHTILVSPYQTAWRYSDGKSLNGGVEWRCGRQKSRFWAYIWLHCPLLRLQQARCCQHGSRWTTDAVPPQVVTRIAGRNRRCWLREKTTKCLWQEASTLRQRQQNSAFNCTQWQICSLRN